MGERAFWLTRKIVYRLIKHGLDMKVVTKGLENLPRRGIIASNHQSYSDAPFILYGLYDRPISFLASDSITKKPILDKILRIEDQIILPSRHRKESKMIIDEEVRGAIEKGYYIGIFPEGKINTDKKAIERGELLDFKRGGVYNFARNFRLPVVPVMIWGTHEICPKPEWVPKRSGRIVVRVGKARPYETRNLPDKLREDISAMIREEITYESESAGYFPAK